MLSRIFTLLAIFPIALSSQKILHKIEPSDFHTFFLKESKEFRDCPLYNLKKDNIGAKLFPHIVENISEYSINENEVSFLLNESPKSISFNIEIEGRSRQILLQKKQITSNGYKIKSSSGYISSRNHSIYYRGIVANSLSGVVALRVSNEGLKLLVADEKGNYEINRDTSGRYYGYYADYSSLEDAMDCLTEALPNVSTSVRHDKNKSNLRFLTGDCVELYMECDYQAFVESGGTISDAESWVIDLINEVAMLYDAIGIPLVISEIMIHDVTDPYTSYNNPYNLMLAWQDDLQDNYNGRLAHFLCGRNIGGGVGWIDVLCQNYTPGSPSFGPYAVSGNLVGGSVTPFPTYSWNVVVVAHEMGHNFGSQHTHNCVWNGNNTQIDDCGWVAGDTYPVNYCYDPNNPIIPSLGTVMSYCHLVSGSGISFSQGFGTQPGDVISLAYLSASCNTGTNCTGVPPANDDCIDAITLIPGNACNPEIFDNLEVSSSGALPSMSCGNVGAEKDVWFKFEVPSTGSVTIETTTVTGGLTDMIIEAYSGTCSSLVSIACDDNSGSGNQALLQLTSLTEGDTIYVRVVESGSDEEGEFGICVYDEYVPCPPVTDILLELYNATNGANWTNNSGWIDGATGNDCDYCQWYGVTCDFYSNVTQINLQQNNLVGILPSSITTISTLGTLKLGINSLSGSIPQDWSGVTNLLYADFSNNQFTGNIPESFGSQQNLWYLAVQNNQLSGNLPSSIGDLTNLVVYYGILNNLSGCYPDSYQNLCAVQVISFANNSGLPDAGANFAIHCVADEGYDHDVDGYCNALSSPVDCDDTDNTIYPGAVEICDNKDNDCNALIDDNTISTPQSWISGSGNWDDMTKWSMGFVPLSCNDVLIDASAEVTLDDSNPAYAKSILLSQGNILNVNTDAILNIDGGGNLKINGTLNNSGSIIISNCIENNEVEIINGIMNNQNGSILDIH
ncbi:MAG: M12 family metallo-peptidase [Saprospiraceae bacterium]